MSHINNETAASILARMSPNPEARPRLTLGIASGGEVHGDAIALVPTGSVEGAPGRAIAITGYVDNEKAGESIRDAIRLAECWNACLAFEHPLQAVNELQNSRELLKAHELAASSLIRLDVRDRMKPAGDAVPAHLSMTEVEQHAPVGAVIREDKTTT